MTLSIADRLFETTISTGTGPFTLAGAVAGFQGFSVLGTGKKTTYYIDDADAVTGVVQKWMDVIGTVTIAAGVTTLSVDQVLASSAGGTTPVSFGVGTKNVRGGIGAKVLPITDVNLNNTRSYGVDTGTANAHAVALPYTPLAYSDGMMMIYRVNVTNTTAGVTVNVNAMGAKALKINGADPGVGTLSAGTLIVGVYKASNNTVEVISGCLPLSGGNMTGAINEALTTLASSASPNIWSNTGNLITYTGTATATGFAAAPQAGSRRTLVCDAGVAFTSSANMLIDGIASGQNFTAGVGDRIEVTALTTTQFRLRPIKATGIPVVYPPVSTFTGAAATGTTTIPSDDTIPQNNEGDEFLSVTITPKKTTSILVVDWQLNLSNNSGSGRLTAALFQDAVVGALKAVSSVFNGAAFEIVLTGRHVVEAGSIAPTTFKVRAGGSAGGTTTTLNGGAGVRKLGGVSNSFITVTEYTTA